MKTLFIAMVLSLSTTLSAAQGVQLSEKDALVPFILKGSDKNGSPRRLLLVGNVMCKLDINYRVRTDMVCISLPESEAQRLKQLAANVQNGSPD